MTMKRSILSFLFALGLALPSMIPNSMNRSLKLVFLALCFSFFANAQTIRLEFPAFAGKTYDFIIFQGDRAVKLYENEKIPENGFLSINIPAAYAPYTGMCRWLLTNTAGGGGLDMAIPGFGFRVSCLSDKPNESNIVWDGYDAMNELNRLHRLQQNIIERFETMTKVLQLYDDKHPLYATFQKERETQRADYLQFQQDLKKNSNYNARFLPIVNLVNGIPPKLTDSYEERADMVNEYITQELNFDHLYTSGHWTGIIQSWVQMHAQMYNDRERFVKAFNIVGSRITDPKKYTDFVGKVTYALIQYTKDDFIEAVAPLVLSSGKITSYEGKTMQVYVKAMVGTKAPDLIIVEHSGKLEKENPKTYLLKSKDFAKNGMHKTLLIFYESGCGPCEAFATIARQLRHPEVERYRHHCHRRR